MIDVKTVVQKLGLKPECCADRLDAEVCGGYVGDLLSDVMGNSEKGQLWVTRQVHQNIVAVAVLKELAGIIIVQGAVPDQETLRKAAAEGVPLLCTPLSAFEVVGRIHRLLPNT